MIGCGCKVLTFLSFSLGNKDRCACGKIAGHVLEILGVNLIFHDISCVTNDHNEVNLGVDIELPPRLKT